MTRPGKLLSTVAVVLPTVALMVAGWQTSTLAEDGEADIVVVTNKQNAAKVLTREDLRPLFQTTKTEWSDGTKAVPVYLPEDNAVRQKFDAAVLGLDPDRVERYWIDRKIRGGERPPRKVPTPAAVLLTVSSFRGGVGYV